MITHEIRVLFGCDESGARLVSTAQIVEALSKAGLDVESGSDVLIVRWPEPL